MEIRCKILQSVPFFQQGKISNVLRSGEVRADDTHLRLLLGAVDNKLTAEHGDVVEAYVKALLAEHQQMAADPDAFVDQASAALKVDADVIGPLARDLIAQGNWPVDGGLTTDKLAFSIDFYTTSGNLKPGLKPEDVADLSFLQAALKP